jgi:outer membrane receptor protein involved in Fe transport
MLRRTFGVLLCLVLLSAAGVAAQEQQAAITGIVKDNTGAVIPGATIEARSAAGGVLTTTTDEGGHYRFPSVLPGTYSLTASLPGFTSAKVEQILLRVGQTATIEIQLTVGGLAENVQVTSEAPLIDLKSNTAATTISSEVIVALPKGRDFTSVIKLAPGANPESKSGGIQIDGASGSENRFYIDGVDSTNMRTGVSAKDLVVDFVEQVQVKTSGTNAEFRGSTGGVINVVTKSGTNLFRGSGGTEYQTRGMEGTERQTLRIVLTGLNEAEHVRYREDEYTRWYPIFELGGPIFRDRMWFYGGYAGDYRDIDRTVTFRTGGSTGTFNSGEKTNYVTGKFTGQLSQALRTTYSITANPFKRDGILPNQDGAGSPTADYAGQGREQPNTSMTGQADYVASHNVFFAGKVNYYSQDDHQTGIPDEIWYQFTNGSPSLFPEVPANLLRPASFSSVVSNSATVRDKYTRLQVQGDATFFIDKGGQHSIKTGVLFERLRNDVFSAEQQPHISYSWNQARSTLDGRTVRGTYGFYSWRQFGTQGDVRTNNVGLFVQDTWTPNSRLTINGGLRVEKEEVPSYVEGLSGIKFSFSDKLAPRVGATYDLKGDGKWKLYGSYGIYYDLFKLELPRGAFGGDKWKERYYTLDTLDWPSIGPNGNFPGTFIEEVDFRIPSNDPACPECGAIDPDLKPMRQTEFTAGLEHEFNSSLSLGLRFVHKQIDRAIEDIGVLVPGIGEVFYIGNPGEGATKSILGAGFPDMPTVQRDYDAIEAHLTKRFSNRWRGDLIYRYARLYGNYPGLASSDENGRVAPNVERMFDALLMAFDQNGDPVFGRLETDRPHELKLSGSYLFPFGTQFGFYQYVGSGTPVSRQVNVISSTPMFYLGRESDGRLPTFTQTDLRVSHDVRIGGKRSLNVYVDVLNLFDQETALRRWKVETRAALPLSEEQVFAGFDTQAVIAARNIQRDPRFLRDETFQDRRVARVGVRFLF